MTDADLERACEAIYEAHGAGYWPSEGERHRIAIALKAVLEERDERILDALQDIEGIVRDIVRSADDPHGVESGCKPDAQERAAGSIPAVGTGPKPARSEIGASKRLRPNSLRGTND